MQEGFVKTMNESMQAMQTPANKLSEIMWDHTQTNN